MEKHKSGRKAWRIIMGIALLVIIINLLGILLCLATNDADISVFLPGLGLALAILVIACLRGMG